MKSFFEAAIANVYAHGDTDIFPFPFENVVLQDQKEKCVALCSQAYRNAKKALAVSPPDDLTALVPAGTTGFRIAAQLDPIWNVTYLGAVLSIAERIEDARLLPDRVFSYRLNKATYLDGDLFRRDVGWPEFILASRTMAQSAPFVVTCDVADCYARISHHKLENALQLVGAPPQAHNVIMRYLANNTHTRSSGLPIGGPASRILAELAFVNVDVYLKGSGVRFVRYADDYHLFCETKQDSYKALISLSKALDNEGLALQKSKTRILTKSEFLVANSAWLATEPPDTPVERLMSLSFRFDPYDSHAQENYEALKAALHDIDIVALLNQQIAQSRIHIPTTKKIVAALSLIDQSAQYGAVLSMLDNMSSLFPICSNVFITISSIMSSLTDNQKQDVSSKIKILYDAGHEVMQVSTNVAFAIRVISKYKSAENQDFLHRCYDRESDVLVRRDIAAVFANWGNFPWNSMFTKRFSTLNDWERRVAIAASFGMNDEGGHWLTHNRSRFTPFEAIVASWCESRSGGVNLPL